MSFNNKNINEQLFKLRNFGPVTEGTSCIENGFIRIPEYTVFIGDQGTGKSTVAKLIS